MIAVITGDIINSRSVVNQDLWLSPLKASLHFVSKGDNTKYEIFRGDSFQLELDEVQSSFKKAIYIKACIKSIKGFDVRLAIGLGKKSYNGESISESNGSAYQNSGNLIDFMKQHKISLSIKADNNKIMPFPYEFNKMFNLYFKFSSVITDNWSVNSAEAVKILMETDFGNQKLIAEKIGIKQDAVSKRLKRSNIEELLELNDLFVQHVTRL